MTKAERAARVAARKAGVAFAPPVRRSLPCRHEGAVLEFCPSCSAAAGEAKHVRDCDLFDRCTREFVSAAVRSCDRCPDYARFPAPTVRHLLYHVYPRRGSRWRERVLRLRERIGLFNGRKVVAVAVDDTTDAAHHVERELEGCGCEILSVPNEPSLREVATFLPLFERVADLTGPEHATLYAHAKGVTRPPGATCHRWAEVLEEVMMGDWPAVEGVLTQFPIAGCFKKLGRGWKAAESRSEWHYSGSWAWFSNRELFGRPDWRRIDRFWSGIEPYPSLHFAADDAGCVFHAAPVPAMNLYSADYWNRAVEPAYAKWRAARPRPLPTNETELKVELGGGLFPRGGGWVNADREPGADVVLDFERDRLPWPDASVSHLYSSHTFEHVVDLKHLLREVARVCRVGAAVEIRVPHWLSEMANCHGHVQTIGEEQVRHWCETAVDYWFGGSPRRLRHLRTERVPSAHFAEAERLFPHLSPDQTLRFVPNACHELRFTFDVIPNAAPRPLPPAAPVSRSLLPRTAWDHVFAPLSGRRVGYVPTSGGEGDRLIEVATFRLLAHFGVRWTVGADPTADAILVAGGGSMGAPHYGECAAARARALAAGPPVWVLPSSWFAPDPDHARFAKLFARDPVSQSHAPGSILAHDLALSLDASDSGAPKFGRGVFLRRGIEGLFAGTPCDGDPLELCTVSCGYLTLAADYAEVVTDRRHFAIAGLVAGRKVTLLPNHNHYNRALWEYSLRALGCSWADAP